MVGTSSTTTPTTLAAATSDLAELAAGGDGQAGVLRVEVGEALAGLLDVDQQDGDELAFGAAREAWRGGAGQSPFLPGASYGSCVRPSLAPPGTRT